MSGSNQAGGTAIPVVVDDRETRAPVLSALRDMDEFDVELRRLPVGDYRLDNRWLVERKTLIDLVASIKAGRLFSQALRLAEVQGLRPVLVLEGTARDLHGCRMRREAIQGALVTVSLFIGVPVLRSRSPTETAQTLLSIARQAEAVTQGALPRRGRRPKNKRALQLHVLQSLPGIGPKRAACLLAHFDSVTDVVAADTREISGLSGIGEHTARRIKWAVEETGAGYRCDALR